MFALVDGNAFYAACEAVFRPDLKGRRVCVGSNNDGCLVAANAEAKALGNIMYQPLFQLEKLFQQNDVVVFSSNYELYGDLSQRMHTLLGTFATAQEVYSIDESFLDFTGMGLFDLQAYGQVIRRAVMKQLGLPVAVGIGATKTLAKAANRLAKTIPGWNGVLSFADLPTGEQDRLLASLPVSDVWGVGRRWTEQLQALGVTTALDLKQAPAQLIRRRFSVVLERTVRELNGIPCQDLELVTPDKQQIVSSRSFSQPVAYLEDMRQAVSRYAARAAEKMRRQGSTCRQVSVGIATNPFKPGAPQYHNWASTRLIHPSDHTGLLINRAKHCLQSIWREGFEYKKAYVMLSDIGSGQVRQFDLFAREAHYSNNPKATALMAVLDRINQRMGRGSCRMAAEGIDGQMQWPMIRRMQSPRYTTQWGELPVAYIK